MGKYNNEMDKLNDSKQKFEHPKMAKCMYMGCPMNASTFDSNGGRCSFHADGDYHQDVTESINLNLHFIKAYSKMVRWTRLDWEAQKNWLLTNLALPMNKGEMATLYLLRYFEWLQDKIKSDSVTIINKRLGN